MFTRSHRFIQAISSICLGFLLVSQPVQATSSSAARLAQSPDPKTSVTIKRSDGVVVQEPLSKSLSASTSCSLPAPTLVAPINDIEINTLIPNYQWTGTGTDTYGIQVSAHSDFSNANWTTTYSGLTNNDISVSNIQNLAANTTYYWRVTSVCPDGSYGSFSTASFRTGNVTGPFLSAPILTAPAEGAILTSLDVPFEWEEVAGAKVAQIRFYRSLFDAEQDQYTLACSYTTWTTSANIQLYSFGTYYWLVIAGNDTAWGAKSAIRSFTIKAPYSVYLPLILRSQP
jgi:hypothetical protein